MARQQKIVWFPTAVVLALSAISVPIAYIINKGAKSFRPELLLILASVVLGATTFTVKRILPSQPKIFYGFALFAFTSVIDVLIPLEIDGFVTNFMDVYLKNGEPYLYSAWGAIAAYWDGTFNLVCYVLMAYYVSNGLPYRNLAIFYSSNILNSMVVLLLGAFLSLTGLHWCTFLNIPYVLLPAYVLWTALAEPHSQKHTISLRGSVRCVGALLLLAAAIINFIRGLSSLGSRVAVMSYYRDQVEPLFNQKMPAPFAPVQGIVGLFYFAPAYLLMAFVLHKNALRTWIKDLAIITSGAALQAEVSLVGMEYHPLTDSEHRLNPLNLTACKAALHWAAHAVTLAAPLLVWTLFCPAVASYIAAPTGKSQRSKEEKDKSRSKDKAKSNAAKEERSKDKNEKSKGKSEKGKDKSEKNKDKKEEKSKDKKEKSKDKKKEKVA